ncbi:MAG TPA: hypothetical protein VG722_05300 [Tepidisphaeraceae bacterium]|nr:hypothetical protein [Tepidisphaeraceae bacterium]
MGHAKGIEQPLSLRGIILGANNTLYVVAAIDFCYLAGRAQRRLEEALARGAGISVEQVALQSNHVHAAPLIDEESHAILAEFGYSVHNEAYFRQVLNHAENAVANAITQQGTTIGGISFIQHPVSEFASTRRVLDADGNCHVRFSICDDQAIRNAPEGKIDPLLRQIVFFDSQSSPVAALSFYASHPQVSDRRLLISGDTIGLATDLFERTYPGVFPIYFTGAAGDVTAGKYTTTNLDRNRLVFGVRLFDGMDGAFRRANPQPLTHVGWTTVRFDVPLSEIPQPPNHFEDILRVKVPNPAESGLFHHYLASMKLYRLRQALNVYPSRISRLCLGDIQVLFLPSEMIVDYQFYANSKLGRKSAVAAYADGFLKYVATDECFDQGGYEVRSQWTEVCRGIEPVIKNAIDRIAQAKI